jgi:FimV-like protein
MKMPDPVTVVTPITTVTQTAVAPTFSQMAHDFSANTVSCLHNPYCNYSNMPTDQMVAHKGIFFVVFGLCVLMSVILTRYFNLIKLNKNKELKEVVNDENKDSSEPAELLKEATVVISAQKEENPEPVTVVKTEAIRVKKIKTAFVPKPQAHAELESGVNMSIGKKKVEDFAALSGGSDVVATQLDLARVYVEMGLEDEARKIAQTIIKTGNEEQKLSAQKLLEKFSKAAVA